MKRPAFQFYPADWRKDASLQSCSIAARGLWVEMMCIMHECSPYGHLCVNGKAMNEGQLARLVGLSGKECSKILAELDGAGVLSKLDDGTIYSRRMVRDEELRKVRAEGGKSGGIHGHKGADYGGLGGRPKGGNKPPLNPPPSSSSSSSSSSSKTEDQKQRGQAAFIRPDDVTEKTWQDYTTLRKAKKSPITQTALDGIRREAEKASYTLEAALLECCARGWQGFKAEWVTKGGNKQERLEASNRQVAASWKPPELRHANG